MHPFGRQRLEQQFCTCFLTDSSPVKFNHYSTAEILQ